MGLLKKLEIRDKSRDHQQLGLKKAIASLGVIRKVRSLRDRQRRLHDLPLADSLTYGCTQVELLQRVFKFWTEHHG